MKISSVKNLSVLLTAGIVAWDVYLFVDGVERNTISAIVRTASKKYPVIPFLGGILVDHWWISGRNLSN